MLLNIITGGIGVGKSEYLYGLIRENLENIPGANAVLIVPEQFSYTAEKTAAKAFGGTGLNRIEVMTFSRLMHRYVTQDTDLLPSGKMMLLSKAASKIGEDNLFFPSAKKQGFMTALSDLFSEFKRYCITPEDLDEVSPENEASQKKLSSVNEIYREYLLSYDGHFSDSDDAPSVFAEFLRSTDTFKNTLFFIDNYSDFMPQHYEVIRAMITSSRGVFITLTLSDAEVFAPAEKTRSKLCAIALSENAQLYTKKLVQNAGYIKAPDIRFLLENWDYEAKFDGKCENISLFTARDLYSEIEHIAAKIISLVRDGGMRFRDFGVVLGDMSGYIHILSAVFADFNIPFFTDEKIPVTAHPIARTLLSLFDITSENWSYSAVFDYLRSGYIYIKEENGVSPISQEDVDILENYVLSQGIRGRKAWFSPWLKNGETAFDAVIENYTTPDYDLEHLNILREQIITPFKNFYNSRSRRVHSIASAVFKFLCDINLYDGILYECDKFDNSGLRDESEQMKQVWNTILEVLNQLVLTAGNDSLSRERFADYLRNGLSQCSLAIIPSGLDRVFVGTVSRNSPHRVRALFIAGAVYGSIPLLPSSSPILSSLEREVISESLLKKDKELAPDDLSRMNLENLKLYKTISTATDKLFISYPAANSDGNALSAATFIGTLLKMFPDITKSDNIISKPSEEELLSSSRRGFYYLLSKVSEYKKASPDALWSAVFDWYAKNGEFSDKLQILKDAAEYRKIQPHLSRAKAELIFGKNRRYSITALEKYSRCPFAYYLEKGLKAEPQATMRVEKSHIGSLIHWAVCEFSKRVEKNAKTIEEIHSCWLKLTEETARELIGQVMEDIKDKVLSSADERTPQLSYLLSRCEKTLKKSVETIRKSLSMGGYTAVCYEKDFEVSIDWKKESITLFGTIDRIDVMEKIAENRADIRIIDYKTGHKKFSIASVVNKIDMQLVLYALAAVSLYKNGGMEKVNPTLTPNISAIMYNTINDDPVTISKPDPQLAREQLKNRLDGVIILDDTIDPIADMDNLACNSGKSEFLNISYKKDGSLSATSQVTSRQNFDMLCDYMKKSVIDISREIEDGNISITPYKNTSSPCTYCDFSEVCMQEKDKGCFRSLISGDSAALDFIKKELEENE